MYTLYIQASENFKKAQSFHLRSFAVVAASINCVSETSLGQNDSGHDEKEVCRETASEADNHVQSISQKSNC